MENMNESCRICLKVAEDYELLVAHPDNYSKDYLTLIKECISTLEISYDDVMPKRLCVPCSNEVLISYRLRKKAISSEKILQNMIIKELENKFENKDIENLDSAASEMIAGCGNNCEKCIFNGCSSDISTINAYNKEPKTENNIVETKRVNSPCRFCGSEQNSCNICTLPEDKPDISCVEITSISPTDIINEPEEQSDPIVTTEIPAEITVEQKNSYECSECEKKFLTKSRLKKHIMTHTPDKPYHCKNCKWSFATNAELETHTLVNHNTIGKNECVYCQKIFKEKRLLRQHMITHKTQKRFTCRYCMKGFNLLHHLKNHEKIHENKSEFECQTCLKKFLTKDRLLSHQKTHTSKKYRCSICEKGFISSSQLSNHESSHLSKSLFVCPSCGLQFNEKSKFDRHQKLNCTENNNLVESDVQMKKSVCLECHLGFNSPTELKQHMKILHTSSHICKTCNKSFLKLEKLENHMKIHSDRLFTCNFCNESFNRVDHLKSHVSRKHNEMDKREYKFACPECELRTHERLHSNEKPFTCKICTKSYSSASGLEQHLTSSHTKEVTVDREITFSLQDIIPAELNQTSILTLDMNL
uniref:CSON015422 protein n=1 Tax=Culicoides sonorensis TaxID=179676 RepID=A0A336K6Z8_CULSO